MGTGTEPVTDQLKDEPALRYDAGKPRYELIPGDALEELAKVYKLTFEEMSDPWEITANGRCKVEEITPDAKRL